jgi:hypothetical protein
VFSVLSKFFTLASALALLAATPQSNALLQVLSAISHFDEASLIAISSWASYADPQAPDTPLTDLDNVEVEVLKLPPQEREALFAWLEHAGRAKLYALGVTDSEIGPCRDVIDSKDCRNPSPSPLQAASALTTSIPQAEQLAARELSFHADTSQTNSGIEISGGFASTSEDATAFTHCIGFANVAQKTIAAVTFTYRLVTQSGEVLEAGSDIVIGPFQAGSQTRSPASLDALQTISNAGQAAPSNCWTKTFNDPDPALVHAAGFVAEVTAVTYEDGNHWSL